ncbi:hypothetical protein GQ44DRAFT_803413 [Phaeosphaeriaceae sp. PMI808]|nr:hypothetical protein GQ44DRAFT_803413 [Phaeosphaeriaceae sp. PMI808]
MALVLDALETPDQEEISDTTPTITSSDRDRKTFQFELFKLPMELRDKFYACKIDNDYSKTLVLIPAPGWTSTITFGHCDVGMGMANLCRTMEEEIGDHLVFTMKHRPLQLNLNVASAGYRYETHPEGGKVDMGNAVQHMFSWPGLVVAFALDVVDTIGSHERFRDNTSFIEEHYKHVHGLAFQRKVRWFTTKRDPNFRRIGLRESARHNAIRLQAVREIRLVVTNSEPTYKWYDLLDDSPMSDVLIDLKFLHQHYNLNSTIEVHCGNLPSRARELCQEWIDDRKGSLNAIIC